MMRLLLIAHAETDWNAAGRYQGHADPPLNPRGRRQAALLAARLTAERIDAIYASDLRRAWETARAIAAPNLDARLRELHFGDWEGHCYDDVCRSDPAALAAWERDPVNAGPPGGESLARLGARVNSFLQDVVWPRSMNTVLVVAHRGSLRVLLCLALGRPLAAQWDYRLDLASLSRIDVGADGAVLVSLNDIAHLREATHAG